MNIVKLTYRTMLGAMLLLPMLAACTGNEVPVPEVVPLPEKEDLRIRWDVQSEGMADGRALIEEYQHLQDACTWNGDVQGKAIGIWSAYVLDGQEKKHVLGNPEGNVTLRYYTEENIPTDEETGEKLDNYEGWLYGDSAVHWTPKAKYTFNAYFPMSVVDEISTSDVSTFVVDYNTEHYQEDLMTAYATADTEAFDFDSKKPVKLNMLHTLSALKFRFMFKNSDGSTYEDNDALTACWLENTVSGSGLATTGVLAFGNMKADGTMDGEHIHWYHEDHPEPPTAANPRRFYAWEDAEGVAFSSTENECNMAEAHSTNRDGRQRFGQNNGWVLTIPQPMDGTVVLGFKLASTGELEHRIHLPAMDNSLEPGKRYIYDIRFGSTEVTVKLGIAPWNEMKSSHNIPL